MSGNLVANILDKIATLTEHNVQINAQILTATKKTNEILGKEIHNELKKQTGLLGRLVDAIAAKSEKTGDNVKFNLFGGNTKIDGSFLKQLEKSKISEKSLRRFASGINAVAASIERFADAINKIDQEKLELTLKFFSSVTKSIALFALTIVLAAPALLIGTMVTLPLLLLWGAAFALLGKHSKNVDEGAKALKGMGIAVGLLGIAVAGYIFFNGGIKGAVVNSAVVALSVFILALPMLFIAKYSKNLVQAALGLGIMAISIWLLGMAVKSYYEALGGDTKDPLSMLIATATVAGSLLLIGGAFWAIGQMMTGIIKGAVGMLIAGVSVIVLAKAVEMWMAAAPTWESIAMLGATVLGLGVAMAAAGALSSLIIPGAFSMLIAAVAIIPLAKGMQMWVKANASWEDIGMLGAAIVGLGAAMAGWGLVSWLIIPGAAAMLIASTGLYAFTAGLVNYKEANWKDGDTDSMLYTMETILTGFVGIFENMSYKSIAKALFGTVLLGQLGNSMSQFAQGVAAMAKLQAPEYAVEDGKLVLVGTKPLDPNFAAQVGKNIQVMLDAVIDPLARLGENEGMFFDGPVGNGIDLLGRLGNSLSDFALGVNAMAQLQAPTFDVKDGKLVLVGTRPLDPEFAQKLGQNIAMMTGALIEPMKKLGEQEGTFFNGPVGKGIELLGDLGNSLANFAEGVAAMANLQVPTYAVKDGKLTLVGTKPLDPAFAQKVGDNIGMIVNALIAPISELGKNSGFWFDSDFEAGLTMLGELGEPVADLAEGVAAFSALDAAGLDGKKIASNITALAKGIHASFSKKGGYDPKQGASLRYFADTLGVLSKSMNLKTESAEGVGKAFTSITKSVNDLDLKKLSKLNKLMINFNKLAKTLKSSFDDVDSILDKLLEVVEQLNEAKSLSASEISTNSKSNSGIGAKVAMPDSIKINNLDELMGSLDDIKNVLLGTIDVRVDENLL